MKFDPWPVAGFLAVLFAFLFASLVVVHVMARAGL